MVTFKEFNITRTKIEKIKLLKSDRERLKREIKTLVVMAYRGAGISDPEKWRRKDVGTLGNHALMCQVIEKAIELGMNYYTKGEENG